MNGVIAPTLFDFLVTEKVKKDEEFWGFDSQLPAKPFKLKMILSSYHYCFVIEAIVMGFS